MSAAAQAGRAAAVPPTVLATPRYEVTVTFSQPVTEAAPPIRTAWRLA